jgi:hypothetical protein
VFFDKYCITGYLPYMEKFLKALSTVLRYITPLKTFLLIVIIFALIGAIAAWENRQSLFTSTVDNIGFKDATPPLVMSPKSKAALEALVAGKDKYVISGAAVGINIPTNTRTIVYRYFNDKVIERAVRTADTKEGDTLPLFSSNEGQNKQILSLIQGEFSCGKLITGGVNSRYAGAETFGKIVATCRVPIPPAYGHLIGYIVFHLSRDPSEAEMEELRVEAYTLSMNIYNEILKQNGPVRRVD